MVTLEERLQRLPEREDRPSLQELRESAKRRTEPGRLDFFPRWGKALHDQTKLTMLALMNLAGELTSTEL